MHAVDGLECTDVDIHNFCLTWGLPLYGDFKFTRLRSVQLAKMDSRKQSADSTIAQHDYTQQMAE